MPRPVLLPGGVPARAKQLPSTAFEELLILLRGEHERLYGFVDSLERENSALRTRLQLCGEIADTPEDARQRFLHPVGDAQLLTAHSVWRHHVTGHKAHSDANRQVSVASPAAVVVPADAVVLSPKAEQASVQRFLEGISEKSNNCCDGEAAGGESRGLNSANLNSSIESQISRSMSEERRVLACQQKLRDMFDLSDSRQMLNLENFTSYLSRVGLDNAGHHSAVSAIFDRLVAYEGVQSASGAASRLAFANAMPSSSRQLKASGTRRFSSTSSKALEPQVQLETFAELLLTDDVDKYLSPVTDDLLGALQLLRTHVFQQDLMGILPTEIAAGDLAKENQENRFDRRFDMFMNVVIAANAISMGVFAQQRGVEWGTPQVLDLAFTIIFLAETIIKLQRLGFRDYFCGKDWAWNCFDSLIVALGISDFVMTLAVVSSRNFNPSSLMALRLLRLARLLRVVRMSLFRELKLMINGIVGLFKTLSCALVILLVAIYFIGTVMVQLFGGSDGGAEVIPNQHMLFSNVPRSMFTVFRCLNLGDCTAVDGTPIALQMSEAVGWPFTIIHCILSVLMNYGLGSLITALVVDTTLNEAKKAEFRNSLKDSHKKHMSWSLHRLEQIFEEAQRDEDGLTWRSPTGPSMLFLSRKSFQTVLKRQDVQQIMDEMDIDAADRSDLFDALDADGNGRIEVDELVGGLIRMCGKARRADTVATRLKVDSLVKRWAVTSMQMLDNQRLIHERLDHLFASTPTSPVGEAPPPG